MIKETVETGWAILLNTVFCRLEKENHKTGIHSIKHAANPAIRFIFLIKFTESATTPDAPLVIRLF